MIQIKEAVIVEGKYDKIKLANLLDTLIIQTNGFSIHKDKEKLNFIKRMAKERGVLILTDSDHAGFQIRSFLSGALPKEQVKHAYIPDVFGKEKRKDKPSKEGKLGVEGVDSVQIMQALQNAGVLCCESAVERQRITNAQLYQDGFSGGLNSKSKKKQLLQYLELPEFLSTNSFLQVLNSMMSLEEYLEAVAIISAPHSSE